eukprot:CAMPEP_0118971628 /NCGR_PEP_ID=MMETSP1173-20130426/8199_1 /TAXON_ID=1034831 /ORGANISM="Rhizochromulina marina cf, Strain CCMP1243" /LENGTH=50 /DNA_ID=CAMNT_0006921099 /DNA_START=78 /DNA_END=227 /DNA_ORIENTATION=+
MTAGPAGRRGALGLYRRCLRAAGRCPDSYHRQAWMTYCRIKFKEGASVRD